MSRTKEVLGLAIRCEALRWWGSAGRLNEWLLGQFSIIHCSVYGTRLLESSAQLPCTGVCHAGLIPAFVVIVTGGTKL